MIRGLHDILPAYREALERWLELHEDVPTGKTGIPWLYQRDNPIFADLWALIEAWALEYNLTFESHPAEWILEHARQNLTIWTMPSDSPCWRDADPRWGYLDNFVGGPKIRGKWITIFYTPVSMTHEDAQVQFVDQIADIDARAKKLGAWHCSGFGKT